MAAKAVRFILRMTCSPGNMISHTESFQVCRIYASVVIAFVMNLEPSRYWTYEELMGPSVGGQRIAT